MGFDSLLVHRLAIERAAEGAVDDQNMPAQTWTTLAEVAGLIQPKSARETAQLNQAGVVVSTHTIYLRPTDITAADRIRALTGPSGTYQLDAVRDAAGLGHHFEIDAQMVAA